MKAKRFTMLSAMKSCYEYKKMSANKREALRDARLRELVAYAREHSPYYAKLYENVPESFTLADLPPVNKRELMASWEDWLTVRDVKLEDVKTFMSDLDNVGRWFKGRYLVFTTSGSTGEPLVALCDKSTNGVMGAVNALRAYARPKDLKAFMKRGAKTIGVFATEGFYLSNCSVRSRLLKMPWKKRQMAVTSALLPVSKIVEQLNEFQPAMLGGYPSNLELLIDEAEAGRLRISPVIIMTGGEYLSDELRARLSKAFGCYVQTSYSCTEGGTISCECREKHFHINDDWVIVEPVDSDNNPVPCGARSDKLLITNLYNYTQPFIRYEVTDRVIMHSEPCACGNPSPWLEIEGRTDDVASFSVDRREVKVAPLALYATLKETHMLRRFQLVIRPQNNVSVRLEPVDGATREAAFQAASSAISGFLASQGIKDVSITLSDEEPRQQAGSGKFKHIINEK